MRRWPEDGISPNPGAWITTTARNRAIDRLRRDARGRELLRAAAPPSGWKGDPATEGEPVSDDRLRLISTRLPTPPSPAECRIAIPQNAEEPLNGERSMPSASNFYKASVPAIVANGYLTRSQGQ